MINIDSRPDLIKLLMELNQYNCTFIKDNQIIIELPQFKNKTNESWYGLTFVCKPNRTSIDVYVCKDINNPTTNVYVDNFESIMSLDELICVTIERIKTCNICKSKHELNQLYIYTNQIICENCKKNIRSRY